MCSCTSQPLQTGREEKKLRVVQSESRGSETCSAELRVGPGFQEQLLHVSHGAVTLSETLTIVRCFLSLCNVSHGKTHLLHRREHTHSGTRCWNSRRVFLFFFPGFILVPVNCSFAHFLGSLCHHHYCGNKSVPAAEICRLLVCDVKSLQR